MKIENIKEVLSVIIKNEDMLNEFNKKITTLDLNTLIKIKANRKEIELIVVGLDKGVEKTLKNMEALDRIYETVDEYIEIKNK